MTTGSWKRTQTYRFFSPSQLSQARLSGLNVVKCSQSISKTSSLAKLMKTNGWLVKGPIYPACFLPPTTCGTWPPRFGWYFLGWVTYRGWNKHLYPDYLNCLKSCSHTSGFVTMNIWWEFNDSLWSGWWNCVSRPTFVMDYLWLVAAVDANRKWRKAILGPISDMNRKWLWFLSSFHFSSVKFTPLRQRLFRHISDAAAVSVGKESGMRLR